MKVILLYRRDSIHEYQKDIDIPGQLKDYLEGMPEDFDGANDSRYRGSFDSHINEDKLIKAIPGGFLPHEPRQMLLTIGDKDGSTGQRDLKVFSNWGKWFNTYILELND